MLVQLPLASLKTKEIGFFRTPPETSLSWSHVRYSSTATLNGHMFLFGSTSEIHQRDIAIVRNCGFEMYFYNGQQIKFAGLDDSFHKNILCQHNPSTKSSIKDHLRMRTTQANSFDGVFGNYILICSSFYHEHSCFHFNGTTPTNIQDTLWSHKLGILSTIDEQPFLISGYRKGQTIKTIS